MKLFKETRKLTEIEQKFLEDIKDDAEFEPISVLKWGQIMATILLNTVKAVEKKFGRKGQRICKNVSFNYGVQLGQESSKFLKPLLPEKIDESNQVETWLNILSWMNRNIYASPDAVKLINKDEGYFDIIWCPHQDIYSARDCRIQRWVVSGFMTGVISSLHDILQERYSGADFSNFLNMNVEVTELIPKGAKTCHFRVWKRKKGEDQVWEKYSKHLEDREMKDLEKK